MPEFQNPPQGANITCADRLKWAGSVFFKNGTAAAAAAGVSIPTFSRWIAGQEPSFAGLVKLSEATGVSLDWIATGTGALFRVNSPARREMIDSLAARKAGAESALRLLGVAVDFANTAAPVMPLQEIPHCCGLTAGKTARFLPKLRAALLGLVSPGRAGRPRFFRGSKAR